MLWEARIHGTFALVICDFIINIVDLDNTNIILVITLFPLYENAVSVLPPNIKGPKECLLSFASKRFDLCIPYFPYPNFFLFK